MLFIDLGCMTLKYPIPTVQQKRAGLGHKAVKSPDKTVRFITGVCRLVGSSFVYQEGRDLRIATTPWGCFAR